MKEIHLTQNKIALVDNEDFKYLVQWKWCACKRAKNKDFVAVRNTKISEGGSRKIIYMHREVLESQYTRQ